MNKIYAFLRHNSGVACGVPLCFLVLIYCYSCESSVISLVNSELKVTRTELIAEVEVILSRAEARFADLDRQDLVKDTIFNSVLDLAQGGSINPAGLALVLGNIIGLGAVIDNVRKRTHINTLKGESLNVQVHKSLKEILQPEED